VPWATRLGRLGKVPDRSTNENKWVEAYLHYLATQELPTDTSTEASREALDTQIESEERLHVKVKLIAQRLKLDGPSITPKQLEERFLDYGATFGERNQITYPAWRAMGVPPRVLRAMGLKGSNNVRPRDPNRPKQVRYRLTEEHADNVFRTWKEGGPDLVCSSFALAPVYVTTLLRELSNKYPDIAAKYGYDHSAEVSKSMARNVANAREKRYQKRAS
jgi:hypothetical protein